MSRTPPLPALAEGIIVIQPPQLPLLQLLLLQLQLQPRTLPIPHVPPTQLLLALAGGTIVILQQTPLHLALVEGIIVVPLLDQKVGCIRVPLLFQRQTLIWKKEVMYSMGMNDHFVSSQENLNVQMVGHFYKGTVSKMLNQKVLP